jgi:hypothetical protein
MSVDTIKSKINTFHGVSQPCYYLVNVIPPFSLFSVDPLNITGGAVSLASASHLSILAESASLPGRTLASTTHQMFGTRREMPYGSLYDSMNITFICTNSMIERSIFNAWHEHIMQPKSTHMKYYRDYVGTVVIMKTNTDRSDLTQLKNFGDINLDDLKSVLQSYVLEEAYPKTIQAQELSYSSTDEYLKLTVEFSYARFRTTTQIVGL